MIWRGSSSRPLQLRATFIRLSVRIVGGHTCDVAHVDVGQLDDLAGHDIPHRLGSVPPNLFGQRSGKRGSNSTSGGGLSDSAGSCGESRGESGHFCDFR